MFERYLVFIHVLAVISFFLFHGTSAAMAFKLRKETDFTRIRAMLDLSASTMMAMGISFLVMGLTGLIMPFLLHIWDKAWIWLSIVLMLIVAIWMGLFNEKSYKILRKLVGLPYMQGNKEYPAEPPASAEEVAAHLNKINAPQLAVVGYALPALVLWLMIFKPF
jgi:hypothetical protein